MVGNRLLANHNNATVIRDRNEETRLGLDVVLLPRQMKLLFACVNTRNFEMSTIGVLIDVGNLGTTMEIWKNFLIFTS